jgi:hypothetical protein
MRRMKEKKTEDGNDGCREVKRSGVVLPDHGRGGGGGGSRTGGFADACRENVKQCTLHLDFDNDDSNVNEKEDKENNESPPLCPRPLLPAAMAFLSMTTSTKTKAMATASAVPTSAAVAGEAQQRGYIWRIFLESPFAQGMVQAWVGQKTRKRDILRIFFMSHFINV